MDVIGVGDAAIDIYLEVDHIPSRDEKLLARSTNLYPGGMVANFLVALRRLGTPCGFHGLVGDDEFGRLTISDLAINDVDINGAVIKQGGHTYFCVIMLDESGEKSLVIAPTNCLFPLPDDVSEQVIARARHLHTTATIIPTVKKAISLARRHGLTISLDLESTAVGKDELWSLLTQVDILFTNQRAIKLLCEAETLDVAADVILNRGLGLVCITMGRAGTLILSSSGLIKATAFAVRAVDTTGAGDAFAAGFVHGFLRGWPLPQLATFASAVAAINVTCRSGHAGVPTLDEVNNFLREYSHKLPVLESFSKLRFYKQNYE